MIDQPTFERIQTEMEGAKAYRQGVKVGDCPYDPNSESHWYWLKGWTDEAAEKRARKVSGE